MPRLSPARPRPRRRGRHHWGRELAEAAALFTAMAAADFVADLVDHGPDGRVLLLTSAGALLVAGAFHAWLARRGGRIAGTSVGAAADPADGHQDGVRPEFETALWRLRTTVADTPGSLGRVCTALAGSGVDIVTLQTHPLTHATVDEFLLRAPAPLTAAALVLTVADAGGSDTWLERADAHDLVDPPTRMLALAARTALDPAELPLALRQLFGRCSIRHTPDDPRGGDARTRGGVDSGADVDTDSDMDTLDATVMRLRDPSGGTLTVRRDHLPFTPTEFARARALVALDAQLGVRLPAGRRTLPVPEGGGFTIRRAGADDHAAALALHARCTPETLQRRYHGPVGDADRYLDHLLGPRFGRSLAVETPGGRMVALGHLLWDGDESEVALLVEDAWQRRGIGTALLRALLELAAEAGRESVYAVTRSTNSAMIAAMRGLGLPLDYQVEDGTLVITAPLPVASGAGSPTVEALPWAPSGHP